MCKTISSYFVKGVIIISLLTVAAWTLVILIFKVHLPTCDICWIFERGISVLVASCPCALGLAVPSVIAMILNLATKSGVLIKNNGVFEKMKKAKVIAFDKTGTLFTRINRIDEHILLSDSLPETKIW